MSAWETMAVARKSVACRYIDRKADVRDAFAYDPTGSRTPSAAVAGAVRHLFDQRLLSTIHGDVSCTRNVQTLANNTARPRAALQWKF